MEMASISELHEQYTRLDARYKQPSGGTIDSNCLLAFDYEYPEQDAEVVIDTEEFTAVCPWTGLPDFGTLTIRYVPDRLCIELKSLKYYLLSYRGVGIVQEHAANRILHDLVSVSQPRRMTVTLDYKVRGGLHTTVTTRYDHAGRCGALQPSGGSDE
jgi:7-cyano-7-deazaguanine reductase